MAFWYSIVGQYRLDQGLRAQESFSRPSKQPPSPDQHHASMSAPAALATVGLPHTGSQQGPVLDSQISVSGLCVQTETRQGAKVTKDKNK